MTNISPEEEEKRKKYIFDSMSPRRQKHILRKGYEAWDPFIKPKDPIDIRKDVSKRTTQTLVGEFIRTCDSETYTNEYGSGAFELCLGIIDKDEKCRGMFEFACWYKELLKREEKLE
ncbi:MAG: hypothetical protein JRD93_02090 [Deltaproteobacteria bacterium]|nr:hypothetical protein [Deltaproteobacteria bacterium]MBW2660788.1 hypothetical protein [Deltaproteobacteria bacterium]